MILDTGDWHIDGGRNAYLCPLENFLDFAEPYPLILGGDTLELWAYEWWEVWQGPCRPILDRIAERKQETIVLIGNHDGEEEVLRKFFPKADVRMDLFVGDRRSIHGFQFDSLLDEWQERWLIHNFDRAFTLFNLPWLNALRAKIAEKDRSNKYLIENIEKIRGSERYLVHHSHIEANSEWFANPGSPLRGRFPYIELEDNGDCTLKYFEEGL